MEFTKEQLIASAHARIEFAEMMLAGELEPLKERTWSIELELARIALASLEAKPVIINDDMAYAFHHALSDSSLGADDVEEIKTGLRAAFANVTAPPVPVAVMDEAQSRELFEKNCMANTERNKWHPDLYAHLPAREQWAAWEACRAAMLQGKANVSLISEGKNHTEDKLAMVDHSGIPTKLVSEVNPLVSERPASVLSETSDHEMLKRLAVILSGSDAPGEIRSLTVTAMSFVDRCKTLAKERDECRAAHNGK